jgi:hypothetical protein
MAIVSSLIAIVRKDGLLDGFDHPMLDLFTDRDVANVDERKEAITIQNLLDMTSGLDWDEGKEQSLVDLRPSPDWIKFVLTSASLRTSLPTASRGEGYLSLLLEVVCDSPAASGER